MAITFLEEEPTKAPSKRKITFLDEEAPARLFAAPEVEAPAEPKATFTEGAEDIGRKFLMGGAGGIRSITDVFGANNPVSKAIAGVEDYIAEGLSAESQQNSERISKMFDEAESKGLGAKVAVGLEAFASAPAETLAQVGGYMIPNLAAGVLGKAAKLGKLGMTAAQAATGAAMGAGTVKGEIYRGVTDYLREQGVPEDQIDNVATEAQAYGGKNMDQILLATGIGAAAASTGVEKIFTRILTRTGGEVTEKSIASVLKSGLKGAAAETAVEVPQEMQEQVATNIALQREGAEVPTFRGAVQAGAMAAPAAFLLGGAAGGVEVMTAEDKAEQEINRDADKEARNLSVPEGDTNAKVVVNEINRKENAITSLQEELDTLEPTDPRAQQLRLDIASLQKGKAQLKKRNKETLTQVEEKQAELATAIAAEPTVTPAPAAAELSTTITEPAAPTIREEPQVSPMIGAETTQPAPEAVTPAQPEGIAVGNRIKLGKSPQGYIVEEVIESTPQEKELGEQYFRVKNERTGDTQVVEQRDLIQIKPKRIRAKRGQMTPLPQESQAVFEDVESRVKTFFGGTIPSRVTITNNPNAPDTAKGSYDPETGIIEFNLAFIPKEDNIEDIVTHELGHFMFGDAKVKKAFDAFYNSLTQDEKAQVDKIVQDSYNEETGEVQLEEAQVVAFSSFAKLTPERTSLWNTVLDAIKAALNRVLGTNFLLSDPVRTAIHMVNAARRGYVRGREIPREGAARATAEKPAIERYDRRSQVAGIRNIGSVIDTPIGIKKKTEDIIKKNVIDIDNVSEANTAKAWNLIGRLERSNPDSGKNAQAINELVRESIQDTQADEIVKQAIGGAITRNELLKYAIKLRAQGDSRMLDYLLNNRLAIASGTIDEGDAGRLLNAFQNLKSWVVRSTEAEQAGFIETAASRFFDTKAPTEEQIQQIKDMLTAVKDTKIDQEKELSAELEKVGAATGVDVEGKVQEAINTATPKRDPWMVALEILKKETGLPLAGFSLKPSDVTAKAKAALRPKLADYRKKMTKEGANGLEKGFWKTLSDQEDKPGPLAEVDAAINRNLAAIVKDTLIKAGLKGEPPNTKMTVIEQVASILSNNDLTQERISVLDEKITEAINAKEGAELKAAEEAGLGEDVIDEIEAKYNGLREAWALAMSRQLDIPISDATLRRMVVDEAKESGIDLNEIADISETDPAVAKARKERLAAAIVAKVANVEEATLKLREGVEGLRLMSFLPTNYKPLFDGLVSAIDSSVSARRTKRKAADALKTAKDEAGNPNKQANSQIKRLAKIQSDTQDWGTTKKDAVREIVSSDLKNTPDLGRKEAWKSMLVGQLKGAGVNDTQAETLADLVWNQHEKNALTREMDALTKAVEKGAIKGIVDAILNTPLSEQQKPGWREGVIKKYLTDAGVPSQKADNIAKLFDLSLQKRFAEAQEKAAEKAISGLKRKMTPQSKRALEALLKAIRAQVMNPGSDPMKEFGRNMGYTGFTAEQVSKIAELDSIIDDDNTTNAEKSVALRQIQGIISQVSLPPRIRDSISAFYVGNALGRITTMSVQLFDPAIYTAFDTAVDSVRAITNPRLLPTLIGNYFENFGRVAREIAFSFRNDVMRSGPLVDYLDTNDLRITKLWQDGQRLWNQGKYAEGLKKMLFGYTTYTFRTLKALDDGAFSLLRESAVSRYVLAAMDAAKIPKKDQIGVLRGILQAREMDMKRMMAQGVSKTDASVYANERMMGAIAENLSGLKIDSQEVIDSIINDSLSRIGKTRFVDGLTDNKRTEIKDEGALSYVFLKTYEITSRAVQSIPGPGGEAMRIFQRILFGFPLIPARMFNIAAGYTPLTLYRHFLTKNYSLTYGTALQRKQRLIEQMSGAIALAPFLLLRSMSLDDDEDKPIKVYFTGQGPLKSQDKTLHAQWNKVHKPFSMEIKIGDKKVAIDAKASGPLSVMIYTMGAIDDWQIRRRLENQKITDDDWRSVQQKADYIASINDLAGSLVLTTSRRSPTSALMQGLVDFRRYPNDPIASIGAEVSFSALPAVPIIGAGIAKNISDFFSEPVDTTTVKGAMLNNIPIAGPLATQPAINAYGQKVGELQFSEKLKKATGIPFTLTSYTNLDDQKLTNLTLKYGEGPEPLRRADVEDALKSTLTDEEWYTAAKAFGDANRTAVLNKHERLNRLTTEKFKADISEIASKSKKKAVSAVKELRRKQD
jgi:hypothetical protein